MISNVFTLVLATASIANAIPLFHREPAAPAQQLIRRAENNGQLAQGSNFYFQSLHIEDSCTPGQVACVSGSYATCSPEANWEITPCANGTTCLAVPADSSSGVAVQCTTQDAATTSINNAGGETNVIAADYHIVDAPFHAAVVPTATESVAAPTATESASATENASTESASATETASTEDPSSTCVPDEDPEDPTEDPTATETPTPTATEAPAPDETCTEDPEDPVETETITVILVPVPSQSGVFSTTTLFPEVTAAPTETVSSSSASETASSSSDSSSASETASSTEAAPTEVYSYPSADPTPTESPASDSASATELPSSDNNGSSSSTSSEPITPTTLIVPPPSGATETVTSITISFTPDGSAPSIPPVNAPPQATPPIVVVGVHFIPAPAPVPAASPAPTSSSGAVPVKRGMQKKIRRV